MNKTNALIGGALLVITVCLIYLSFVGIGLRTAKLIKPSLYLPDAVVAAEAVVLRLFPDLTERSTLVIGLPLENPAAQVFLERLKQSYVEHLKQEPRIITDPQKLESCSEPCWWITDEHKANSLAGEMNELKNRKVNYLTLTWFSKNEEPSIECKKKLRLDYSCLRELSIFAASRKMKTRDTYFFLNKYGDKDFFLFVGSI